MTDVVVLIILVLLIGSSVTYMVRAKKNGVKCIGCPAGGSCSTEKMPKKRLTGHVIGKKTMKITGMHCAHCAINVAKVLNEIDGVRADIDLSKGSARISYDREIDDDVLKNAVEKIGYHVAGIS